MLIKNSKAAVVAGIAVVWLFNRHTYSQIGLLNPAQFGGSAVVENFLIVGRVIIPYFIIVLLLSAVYIAALWLAMRLPYKKYYLN